MVLEIDKKKLNIVNDVEHREFKIYKMIICIIFYNIPV